MLAMVLIMGLITKSRQMDMTMRGLMLMRQQYFHIGHTCSCYVRPFALFLSLRTISAAFSALLGWP